MIKKILILFLNLFCAQIYANIFEDIEDIAEAMLQPFHRTDDRVGCISRNYSEPAPFSIFVVNPCIEDTASNTYKTPKIRARVQHCNAAFCWTKSTELGANGDCVMWPGPYLMPMTRICARIAVPGDQNTPRDPGYTEGMNVNTSGEFVPDRMIISDDGTKFAMKEPKICAYHDPWMLEFIVPIPFFDLMDFNPVKQPMHAGSGISPIARIIINIIETGSQFAAKYATNLLKSTLDPMGNPMLAPYTALAETAGFGPLLAPNIPGVPISKIPTTPLAAGAMATSLIIPSNPISDALGSAAQATSGVVNSIMEFIPTVVAFVGKYTVIALLKEFGQFNRQVYRNLGCVNMALGYFPPPYCTIPATKIPSPNITMICPDGMLPANDFNCVIANERSSNGSIVSANNAIKNTVRVSFDNVAQICRDNDPMLIERDKCVVIKNATMAASVIYALFPDGMIPVCNAYDYYKPCVQLSSSSSNTNTEMRLVYGMSYNSTILPKPYYNSGSTMTIPDCSAVSISNNVCQVVWGVNIGNFADISVIFDDGASSNQFSNNFYNPTSSTSAIAPATSPLKIIDDGYGTLHVLYASISRSAYDEQLQSNICVHSIEGATTRLIGCVPRAPRPAPKIYQCSATENDTTLPQCSESLKPSDNIAPTNSLSTNSSPLMILKFQAGDYYTQGIIGVRNKVAIQHNTSNIPTSINLLGFDYSAYVTDDMVQIAPFHAPGATNSGTLYGTYKLSYIEDEVTILKDTIRSPCDGAGHHIQDAIYINGMEYVTGNLAMINDKCALLSSDSNAPSGISSTYFRGGTHICLYSKIDGAHSCPIDTRNCVLTKLSNADIVDCATFISRTHEYSGLTRKDYEIVNANSSEYIKIEDIGNNVEIYSYGNKPDIKYYYAHPANSDLCQVTYDTKNRVIPAPTCGDILSNNNTANCGYYEYKTSNTDLIRAAAAASSSNQSALSCSIYLSYILNTPYGNITECSNDMSGYTAIEHYQDTSQSPSYNLQIYSNTTQDNDAISGNINRLSRYCYRAQRDSANCSLSTDSTIRYSDNNGTSTKLPQNVSCDRYLSNFNPISYPGISQCSLHQQSCPRVAYLDQSSKSQDSFQIHINQYSKDSYCYYSAQKMTQNNQEFCNLDIKYPGITQCTESQQEYCKEIAVIPSEDNTSNTNSLLGMANNNEAAYYSKINDMHIVQYAPNEYCYYTGQLITYSHPDQDKCDAITKYPKQCTQAQLYCPIFTKIGKVNILQTDKEQYCFSFADSTTVDQTLCQLNLSYPGITEDVEKRYKYCQPLASVISSTLNTNLNIVRSNDKEYYYYTGDAVQQDETQCPLAKTDITQTIQPIHACTVSIGDIQYKGNDGNVIIPPKANNFISNTSGNFNQSLYALRNKTSMEQGLCTAIPPLPSCEAITVRNEDSGFAIWQKTKTGDRATGLCRDGSTMKDDRGNEVYRYCLINEDTFIASFQALPKGLQCSKDMLFAILSSKNNDVLAPGGSLQSNNGNFRLTYQTDGDLVLMNLLTGSIKNISGTHGSTLGKLVIQKNTNLTLYDALNNPIWQPNTMSTGGGNIFNTIYNMSNEALGSSDRSLSINENGILMITFDDSTSFDISSHINYSDRFYAGNNNYLANGGFLLSKNERYKLTIMNNQLVVLDTQMFVPIPTHYIFSSDSTAIRATMDDSGNFAVYSDDKKKDLLWSTKTSGGNGSYIIINDTGTVQIISNLGAVLWTSGN